MSAYVGGDRVLIRDRKQRSPEEPAVAPYDGLTGTVQGLHNGLVIVAVDDGDPFVLCRVAELEPIPGGEPISAAPAPITAASDDDGRESEESAALAQTRKK